MLLRLDAIGNIGQDAVIKHTNGKVAINFSIAYNESWTDSEGKKHEKTIWLNCTMWRKNESDIVKHLVKGQQVFVTGTPNPTVYESKQSGEPMVDFRLNVKDLKFVGSKPENSGKPASNKPAQSEKSTENQASKNQEAAEVDQNADDLPF
jgi:single-strand DNA-binding protein